MAFVLVTAVAVILFFFYLFNRMTLGVCKSKARLDGKTVIITGCTSGIGKATAYDIASRGARLIMAGIDLDLAHKVRESIVKTTKNENVVVKYVDLSLMESVRMFAEDINQSEPRLDVLIHNAGILIPKKTKTKEGLNTLWATNFFGPFLLTHLLVDLLKKTGKSRIVFVSSVGHYFGKIDLKNPNAFPIKLWLNLYCDTKFAVTLFSNELARRLKATEVTANCLHPGLMNTSIWTEKPKFFELGAKLVQPIFFKSKKEGAQTTIYLAVSEEVENVTGKFFMDCKEWMPAKLTRDADLAKKYWEICEKVVQLRERETHIPCVN